MFFILAFTITITTARPQITSHPGPDGAWSRCRLESGTSSVPQGAALRDQDFAEVLRTDPVEPMRACFEFMATMIVVSRYTVPPIFNIQKDVPIDVTYRPMSTGREVTCQLIPHYEEPPNFEWDVIKLTSDILHEFKAIDDQLGAQFGQLVEISCPLA